MTDGGWKYCGYNGGRNSGETSDLVIEMTAWQDALVTALGLAGTGWSQHTAVASYSSDSMWFSLEHTGGARVVFAKVGYTGSSSNVIHADNDMYGGVRMEQIYENNLFAAYVQPHLSATALGANPAAAGFLPSGSLKFCSLRAFAENLDYKDGEPHGYHVMVRGGNMIFAVSYGITSNPDINNVAVMGECFDRIVHAGHPTEPDNHADSKYGMVVWDDCNYTGTMRCQFFDAAGNHRYTSSQLYYSGILANTVCEAPPYPWQVPLFHVESSNLKTIADGGSGVVTGSGLKGSMNTEWMRYTNFPDGPANNKQRLAGGDFIYLRAGIAVGWDSANGGML